MLQKKKKEMKYNLKEGGKFNLKYIYYVAKKKRNEI